MSENQSLNPQFEPTVKPPLPLHSHPPPPPPPPVVSNSPSRKRLLSNSDHKHTTPSPQSSLSSDSSSGQFRRKTRELPNLSDCHGCKLRINHTNPKDRLRVLDSAWRIVLLCKECIKRVELAEVCSYCFDTASELDCFKCGNCGRLIHKDCVAKYGKSPPWSYCHLFSRFWVCVDCWVPDMLAKSIRASSRRRNGDKVICDSNVLMNFDDLKLVEDALKEADCAAEKKFEILAKAKEDASRKAAVAKNAVALANGALMDFVNKSNFDGPKSDCLEDEELALQLHRAINSSPRIAKNLGSLNYSCLGARKARNSGFYNRIQVFADGQLNEARNRAISEHSVCNSAGAKGKDCQEICDSRRGDYNYSVDNKLHPALRCYHRRNKLNETLHSEAKSIQGILNSGADDNLTCTFRYYQRRNKQKQILDSGDKNTQGLRALLFYSRRNQKRDRYSLKYRRSLSSKLISNGERKLLSDGLMLNNHPSSLLAPLNCSKESKLFSDVPSLQSRDVSREAFAGASGST